MDLARPLSIITPTVDADVLAVLAGADVAFTGRQVHQIAGRHSERGVRDALHRLHRQGIVTRERVGPSHRYRLNRSHLAAPHIEALARLRAELLSRIRQQFEAWPSAADFAALFGSAARGDMSPTSDIDILVVRPDSVGADDARWQDQLTQLGHHVSSWTGNDARLLEFSSAEVLRGVDAGEPVLTEIRQEGLVLYGPDDFLRGARRRRAG